jgi:hypothetical protein
MAKKTQQLNIAITSELAAKAKKVGIRTGVQPVEMARIGFIDVLNRLDSGISAVLSASPAELRALAECHALHVDPVEAMRAAVRLKVASA